MLLTSLIAAALFAFPGNLEGRVFKPRTSVYQPTAKTVDTGVIILQGASIAPSRYAGLANAIQKEFPKPVWVVVPETVFETPLSFLGAGKAIERAKRGLLDHGMAEDGAIFLAGHSLGGIAAQEYVHEHPEFAQGLILMGSALLRKFNVSDPLALPVISINGELDCQFKPMRSAEAYYHSILGKGDEAVLNRPVVIVPSLTHMAPANFDSVPFLVKRTDLHPMVSELEGHSRIAKVLAAFMALHSTGIHPDTYLEKMNVLESAVKSTGRFLEPLIKSLEMEASYHLMPPCNSDSPSPHCPVYPEYPPQKRTRGSSSNTQCFCGSPVAQIANRVMANVDASRFSVVSTDAFQNMKEINPVHLPHIWNDCSQASGHCTLNMTTVTENVYDFLDEKIDAGTTHVAATEIRMKLKSHQAALAASSDPNAHTLDWHVTDSASSCQRINQAIYAETLKLVEPRRLEFFTKYGLPMVFDEDYVGAVPAGPLWIYNPLKTQVKVSSGPTGSPSKALHVTSNGFVTSLDTVFGKISSYVPGFHYCKLISPAFVMEWIYTDSLRDKLGWGSESGTVPYHLQPFA